MTVSEPLRRIPRVDALDKVRGKTLYGADRTPTDLVHGVFAVATVGRGTLTGLDLARARAVPGVVDILTHEAFAGIEPAGFLLGGGFSFQSVQVLLSPKIHYRGQPIALVLARSYEAATEAAHLVKARYAAEPFHATMDDAPPADVLKQATTPLPPEIAADIVAGDAITELAQAPVKVDLSFSSPPQHQNPIELVATVAEWRDGKLVIHEGTQNTGSVRGGLAKQLGLQLEDVEVISPFIGGGFGQKNSQQMQTLAAAVAARKLGRPVKIVVPRSQLFHDASFRPAARQRVRLGATKEGKLTSVLYDCDAQTSRHDLFPGVYAETAARLQGIPNFQSHQRLVRTDTQTPGYMRAPFEQTSAFAIETAVDEMAVRLGMDPVQLRLANDTQVDPVSGHPLSSRFMAECLTRGADMFGWPRRSAAAGSMRDRDGTPIGWGVACGAYPVSTSPGIVRIEARADGRLSVAIPGHEMGQGIRTAVTNAVAAELGVDPDLIDVTSGDTRSVPQHLTAGSWGTTTAVPPAIIAARALAAKVPGDAGTGLFARMRSAKLSSVSAEGRQTVPGQEPDAFEKLLAGNPSPHGPDYESFVTFSYSAHFVEVRIDPGTRRIRVPRVVSVVDCGRVMSPVTAESQMRGAVVWGIGACLLEQSEVDPRFGGFLNADLAEYQIPVNGDVGSIEVALIDEPDPRVNEPGVKGLGEVALVGVAPAIGNAIRHATGKRLTDLPFRIEHILDA